MMHFLLDLPTDLAADIVSNWLCVSETVCLDSAICVTSTRPRWAHILSECKWTFPAYYGHNTDDIITWSLKRDVRVSRLQITEESDLGIYKQFLQKRGRTVTRIEYETDSFFGVAGKELLSVIAMSCPNLESLDLDGHDEEPGVDFALREVLVNCTQLQKLSFSTENYMEFNHQSLQEIRCPCLHKLINCL